MKKINLKISNAHHFKNWTLLYKNFTVKCVKGRERKMEVLSWQPCKQLQIHTCENPTILTSRHFTERKDAHEGNDHVLRAYGMGKQFNKTCSLTKSEENTPGKCIQLEHSRKNIIGKTFKSIINMLWCLFTLNSGLQGRHEHHPMKIENFTFRKDSGWNNLNNLF